MQRDSENANFVWVDAILTQCQKKLNLSATVGQRSEEIIYLKRIEKNKKIL